MATTEDPDTSGIAGAAVASREMGQQLWKTMWKFLIKLSKLELYILAVTLHTDPNELNTENEIKPARVFTAELFLTAQPWKQRHIL